MTKTNVKRSGRLSQLSCRFDAFDLQDATDVDQFYSSCDFLVIVIVKVIIFQVFQLQF